MMLREAIRNFLVAALLVSVASEASRNCSICGDGYEVGSPNASTSLSCPDPEQRSSATLCTCEDLEIAGLQGLISECSNVTLVIFEACHCQENTSQNTWFPTYYPSVAPMSFRPSTNAPTPTPAGSQDQSDHFHVYVLAVGFIPFVLLCISGFFEDNIATVCWRACTCRTASPVVEETQQNVLTIPVSTPTVSIGNARSRRPLVLETLFPKEGRLEGDGPPHVGRSYLKYDVQSKHYEFCEDAPDAVSCSICMEFLVPTDDTVSGLCSHAYHRECIMNWLQGGHDDCPNCRQPMWNPDTYEKIDHCIKNHGCINLFAV